MMTLSDQFKVVVGKQVIDYYDCILELISKNHDQLLGKFLNDRNFSSIDIDRWCKEHLNEIISNQNMIQGALISKTTGLRGVIFIVKSDWDSEHFGMCVGRVELLVFDEANLTERKELIQQGFQEARTKGFDVIFSRTPLIDYLTIQALEISGAYLTDTLLTYHLDTSIIEVSRESCSDIEIEIASSKDGPILGILAQKIFKIDHFHADPNFDESKSDELYSKWAINAVRGLADHVILARVDSNIHGFITCKIENFTESSFYGTIGLIGVSKARRQSGIGMLLVEEALGWFKETVHSVYVGTQARNLGAIKLYEKKGFKLIFSEATMHSWL